MASEDRLTKQQLRDPDPFVRVSTDYWNKLMAHQKAITAGVGVTLGVLFLIAIGSHFMSAKGDEAGAALSRAIEIARRPVEGSTDLAADAELPKFKTQKEKNEELAKAFDEVQKKYAGSEAGRLAALSFADTQYQLGKPDEALKAYEEFLAKAPTDDPMRALAYEGQGYLHESKKDYAKATDAFGSMAQYGAASKERSEYHQARMLEAQGKKMEAAVAFQKVKTEYKDSSTARAAGDRLALLGAQGVVPPAVAPKKDDVKTADKK